ncbi:MAG: hypothetical protein EXR93_12145 [Gemmatimonadetes bacterium]|nr:hypothetical protein [Gemmatimonadota bacterium]
MSILADIRKDSRSRKDSMLVLGSHPAIIQSILDFDHLSGKKEPSIVGIVTANRKAEKYFFGTREILIPCRPGIGGSDAPAWMLNLQSGRRTYDSTVAFFETYPQALGGHIFAENVPEKHTLDLMRRFGRKHLIVGPSGVGLLVPGALKLGAIGGIDLAQMAASRIGTKGNIAVISTSGGMTNELIRSVADHGHRLSFAAAIGGNLFLVSALTDLLMLVQEDPDTDALVYFGELGGHDEYEIVDLVKARKFTKPIVAYIAGVIDEAFATHVQFGHAKALVAHSGESARDKRDALRAVGVGVPDTFPEVLAALGTLPQKRFTDAPFAIDTLLRRQKSILSTRQVADTGALSEGPYVKAMLEALIGRPVRSPVTLAFADAVFTYTIDHGGQVSGAVTTMIAARAGKGLVESLAAGLLTVGPRFGGAVNAAAENWIRGVAGKESAREFVEGMNRRSELISGIGHRKYRVGVPDPRVKALSAFAKKLEKHPHYDFACAVEKVTTGKNGKLILNVDGAIAALMLDILAECEESSAEELTALTDAEFFNALFVIPRSVGFIAHFMEQKRNDEGLFRLADDLLFVRKETT